jgi:DNA-binding transcriptional LysR family regulator
MAEQFRARPGVELRQIRYFVTLAEELNFRKAAERLFITQPALSHQIALLEATLGVRLFQRDRRQVALTEEGKALLQDARHLVSESDAILMKARRLGAADTATVRVGFPEYANRTLIPEIISVFRRRHPEARVTLTEGYSRTLLPDLRQGRLDLAFMMIPPADDHGNLELDVIIDEKPGLLMAASHRLAGRSEISLAALDDEQLLLADRSVNPAAYDLVAEWLQRAGVRPRFFKVGGSGAYTYDTVLRVIQSGEAVSLSTASMSSHLPDGVLFRPLHGPAPHFQVAIFWDPTNLKPLTREFLCEARQLRNDENRRSAIS